MPQDCCHPIAAHQKLRIPDTYVSSLMLDRALDAIARRVGVVDRLSTVLEFASVRFEALDVPLLLPVRAEVDASRGDVRVHAVHHLSDFRISGNDGANDPKKNAGTFTAAATPPGAIDLLGQGAAAADSNDAPRAIADLREALRLDPSLTAVHYHLARALRISGDGASAESEVRLALAAAGNVAAKGEQPK